MISDATKRNWKRLGSTSEGRLTSRANKRMSEKRIVPAEYFSHHENIPIVAKNCETLIAGGDSVRDIVITIGVMQLKKAEIINKPNVRAVLDSLEFTPSAAAEALEWPENEADLMGTVYQCLLNEGQKNLRGSYFTPPEVCRSMTEDITVKSGQIFLDPCCGSGAFLLSVKTEYPECLYGTDNDEIAAAAAKINLLLKYPEHDFIPKVYCNDFLKEGSIPIISAIRGRADHAVTNPPWGSGHDKESFTEFFYKTAELVRDGGTIRFLFPEAVLNVGAHTALRKYITDKLSLCEIRQYDTCFSGVVTGTVSLTCKKSPPSDKMTWVRNGKAQTVLTESFRLTEKRVISPLNETELNIIKTVFSKGCYDLSGSTWALGIVTGDNKNKLLNFKKAGSEPILTGRETDRYTCRKAVKHIVYDRTALQQSAPEEVYRMGKKLIYRFISQRPVFALDTGGHLVLNSANVLIPHIPCMSMETVMAFLNSELYSFLYSRLFGEIKILKSNLCVLPFPRLSPEQDSTLTQLVSGIISGNQDGDRLVQDMIYGIFGFDEDMIRYIKNSLNENK